MGGVVDAFSDAIHSIGEATGINNVVDGVWNGAQRLGTDISKALGVKGFFDDLIPKQPDMPEVDYSKTTTARSPTYNSQIRQNTTRLGQAVPEIFGSVLFYPDLVSSSARWFIGAKKSNHLMCLGKSTSANPLVISSIKIGGTPLSEVGASYQEHVGKFTKKLSAVNGSIAIENSAAAKLVSISSVSGVEIAKDANNSGIYGDYSFSNIENGDAVVVNISFPSGLYDIDSSGNRISASCSFDIALILNGVESTTNHNLTNSSPTDSEFFQSISIPIAISDGDSLAIRITRNTVNKTSGGVNSAVISDIFIYDNVEVGMNDVKLIAVQTLANAELSATADKKIAVKASRTGIQTTRQAIEYLWSVMGLDPLELDASALDNSQYTAINGIFDSRSSIYESIKKIARLSRATPVWENDGSLSFFIDEPRAPSMTIDDDILILDSLSVEVTYKQSFENDGVKVRYFDPETFLEKFVTYPTNAVNPRQEDLFGCTDEAQALSEAKYVWNGLLYQNKKFTFKTELDPNILSVGDVVHLYSLELQVDELVEINSINPDGKFTLSISGIKYDERVYL
jgi:hypothetical protein